MEGLDRLKDKWHQQDCRLVCATNGALKDSIGSSSYAIFFPGDGDAIIAGRTCEYQQWEHVSSTRQELLGQLGIDYWFSRVQSRWGTPRCNLLVTLVTDSQSSIEILNKVEHIIGIKDVLQPEMDVALEIYNLRLAHTWILWDIQKVESHIAVEEAPNEFYWECNAFVDSLATKARETATLEDLKKRENFIFLGAKIGCKIAGRIENNSLYQVLKHTINGRELKPYLMEKYSWNEDIFHHIDWTAHYKSFQKTKRSEKVTLTKYLHGWLATNKRRYRERKSHTDLCSLCNEAETTEHLFCCTNGQMKDIRAKEWNKYVSDICKSTTPEFVAVFLAGLSTVLGAESPSERTRSEWSRGIRAAYESQEAIGWEQVLFGRVSKLWDGGGIIQGGNGNISNRKWAPGAITRSWKFGLNLWTVRNHLVHGTTSGVSRIEQLRVRRLICVMQRELVPKTDPGMRESVQRPTTELLLLQYQCQLAWLGKLKFLFPVWYNTVVEQEGLMAETSQESEYKDMAHLDVNTI